MPLDIEKIRRLRIALGLSQEEAAKRARIGKSSHWSRIESGERVNLSIETLERVAKALGVEAKDLLK